MIYDLRAFRCLKAWISLFVHSKNLFTLNLVKIDR